MRRGQAQGRTDLLLDSDDKNNGGAAASGDQSSQGALVRKRARHRARMNLDS